MDLNGAILVFLTEISLDVDQGSAAPWLRQASQNNVLTLSVRGRFLLIREVPDEQRQPVGFAGVQALRARFRKAAYLMSETLGQALEDSGGTILPGVRAATPWIDIKLGAF